MTTTLEVAPCPFCGAPGFLLTRRTHYNIGTFDEEKPLHYISCDSCKARGPLTKSRVMALRKWNKREQL